MPKISVVMPAFIFTYPQIEFMKDAVQSIINQTYQDWELIIVDDGSQMDFFQELPKDNRIKYFKKEHGGIAKARNFGLTKITGDFYTAQDADDSSHPDRLELMIKELEKKKADVVYADLYISSMDWDKTKFKLKKFPPYNLKRLKKEQYIPYFVMVRKEKMVPYRDKYTANDDWMFMIDLAINGAKFIQIKKPLMIYRLNPMSTTIRGNYDGRTDEQKIWIKEDIKKLKI